LHSRWVKYEEDVEIGGQRWSKPYVPTLSLQALYDLRNLLQEQTVILNMETDSLERTCGLIVDKWANTGIILESERAIIRQTLLRKHVHLYESPSSYGVNTSIQTHAPCFTKSRNESMGDRKRKFPPKLQTRITALYLYLCLCVSILCSLKETQRFLSKAEHNFDGDPS
jgi:hypothetical protein